MNSPKFLALATFFSTAAFLAVAADAPAPAAPYTVTLTDVHMCCGNCVKGAASAVSSLKDVSAVGDQAGKSIAVTAPDKATAQKAVDALTNKGFFGKSSSADIKVNADTGAKTAKVSSLEISDLHLCCAKCVTAVNSVLSKVDGVTGNTAKPNAASFTVSGDFSPKAVMDALQKAGLTGKAGATTPEAPAPKA